MAPLSLVFGGILGGAVMIDYGVKAIKPAFANIASVQSGGGGGSSTSAGIPQTIGKFPRSVDPLPGATGSRLDQGADGTGQTFLSPWDGKVVYSSASDPGWKGGGYVAVQSTQDPSIVYYVAEGLTPIVHVGEMVRMGQRIATPRPSPYNGIVGNFEAGLANPQAPQQPLAQVISDPAAMVMQFYHWLLALGGPHATSTSSAGHP